MKDSVKAFPNISNGSLLKNSLFDVISSHCDLFKIVGNISDEGVNLYHPQLLDSIEDPYEFMESLTDMLRVNFTHGMGNMLLNGNLAHALSHIPEDKGVKFTFISMLSDGETMEEFLTKKVIPRIEAKMPNWQHSKMRLAVMGCTEKNETLKNLGDIMDLLDTGLSVEESVNIIIPTDEKETQESYYNNAGTLVIPSLGNKFKVSLWFCDY